MSSKDVGAATGPAAVEDVGTEALPGRRRPGRKPDPGRDAAILHAALEELAAVGYQRMTTAAVAARAKASKTTFYRRWPSKDDLVLDAVTRMKYEQVDLDALPETGALRSDVLGLFRPESVEEGERNLRIMAGLSSLLADRPDLAAAVHASIVEPWAAAMRILLTRAAERGEIVRPARIATLARIIPEMAAYRSLIERQAFTLPFLLELLDEVLLPAAGAPAPATPSDAVGPRENTEQR